MTKTESSSKLIPSYLKYPVVLLVVAVFAFRAYLAKHTDIWSDELVWAAFGSNSLLENLKNLIHEPIPNAPFEVLLWSVSSKPAVELGIDPSLAFRASQLVFASLTGLLPFLSRLISRREKITWLIWSSLSCAISAMALNGRPYSGMIFFSACALFAGLVLARSAVNKTRDRSIHTYLILLIPGPLHQVYVIFPILCLLLFILCSETRGKLKAEATTILTLPIGLFVLWFLILRHSTALPGRDIQEIWQEILNAPWRDMTGQILGTLSNPGKRFLLVTPLVALGLWTSWAQDKKVTIFLVTACLAGVALPILMNFKYRYFFVPRQILAALPFWGWLVCLGINRVLESNFKVWVRGLAVAAICIFIGWTPNRKLLANEPPFIDQPRRRYKDLIAQHIRTNQGIIVLSHCEQSIVQLYANSVRTGKPFPVFSPHEINSSLSSTPFRVELWADLPSSQCTGAASEKASRPELQAEVLENPDAWVVLTADDQMWPKSLNSVKCWNATGRTCQHFKEE